MEFWVESSNPNSNLAWRRLEVFGPYALAPLAGVSLPRGGGGLTTAGMGNMLHLPGKVWPGEPPRRSVVLPGRAGFQFERSPAPLSGASALRAAAASAAASPATSAAGNLAQPSRAFLAACPSAQLIPCSRLSTVLQEMTPD